MFDLPQFLNILPELKNPKLDATFQLWPQSTGEQKLS